MAELQYLRSAFNRDQALCDRILAAAQQSHDQLKLTLDIVRYFTQLPPTPPSPPNKKRKLGGGSPFTAADNGPYATPSATAPPDLLPPDRPPLLALPDVSLSIPTRKKVRVDLYQSQLHIHAGGNNNSNNDGSSSSKKDGQSLSYHIPLSQISHVFCLPVPDKAQKTHNFVLLLRDGRRRRRRRQEGKQGGGHGDGAASSGSTETQFVLTLPETPFAALPDGALAREGDTPVSLFGRALNTQLLSTTTTTTNPRRGSVQAVRVTLPDPDVFAAATGKPGGFHVKAHLGSKEGYLFPLRGGLVFGFKKPVLFFESARLRAVSYTSVLQRTFNLVVVARKVGEHEDGDERGEDEDEDEDEVVEEVEFGMLDQGEFEAVDRWVKALGLEDGSLAAGRKAQRVGVNDGRRKAAAAGGAEGEGDGDGDGETELEKAERELQDREDEEEEDYDPGSEGESEGEGGSEDEEEGDGEGGEEQEGEEGEQD